MRDGDVYRFAYSQESYEGAKCRLGPSDLCWCFDGQLVYRAGRLRDTYWGFDRHSEGRSFTPEAAHAQGTLTFVCNLSDVTPIREDEYPLYADGDAFNLSHQSGCYRKFVKRTDARKDKERLRAAAHQLVQTARKDVESAVRSLEIAIERRDRALPKIEASEEPYI